MRRTTVIYAQPGTDYKKLFDDISKLPRSFPPSSDDTCMVVNSASKSETKAVPKPAEEEKKKKTKKKARSPGTANRPRQRPSRSPTYRINRRAVSPSSAAQTAAARSVDYSRPMADLFTPPGANDITRLNVNQCAAIYCLMIRSAKSAIRHCAYCESRGARTYCTGCEAVYYCDNNNQCHRNHWPVHKDSCREIRAAGLMRGSCRRRFLYIPVPCTMKYLTTHPDGVGLLLMILSMCKAVSIHISVFTLTLITSDNRQVSIAFRRGMDQDPFREIATDQRLVPMCKSAIQILKRAEFPDPIKMKACGQFDSTSKSAVDLFLGPRTQIL